MLEGTIQRIQMPDALVVLCDGAVGREQAAVCGVEHCLAQPKVLIGVIAGHAVAGLSVACIVSKKQIGVVVDQGLVDVHELTGTVCRHLVGDDGVHDALDGGTAEVQLAGHVGLTQDLILLGGVAEDVDVV